LKKEVPPGFARLADPYDPTASEPYRSALDGLNDLSYYKGRLYLYFGVTPALMFFWPFVALTGHYLSQRLVVLICCSVGFLASMSVLVGAWRRYFPDVRVWVVAAGALALGWAMVVPVMLPRSDVYEVAISCGYMLTMLAVGAIWGALHKPEQRCWWLAAASAAYGLAIGARPTLLFGAAILLVPLIQAWREGGRVWTLLLAAIAPIALIGSGILLYNGLRFDNPFEFGQHYQLADVPAATHQYFNPRFFWFNFRVYLLEPARWKTRFPFVNKIAHPPLPAGYGQVELPFGILTNIPLVWFAAAVPLSWRGRAGQEASKVRLFAAAVAWLFVACALPLVFFSSAIVRYEVDFTPALVLLAVIGLLGLERATAPTSEAGQVAKSLWRRDARWGWGALLSFSVAFNLLASAQVYAGRQCAVGVALAQRGRLPEAILSFRDALRINPDFPAAHDELGRVLERSGQAAEAVEHYRQAVRLRPDYATAQVDLGNALLRVNNLPDAITHYEQALQHRPDYANAHNNLGVALARLGQMQEAVGHWEQAVRIDPDYAEAHCNLGVALAKAGRIPEGIEHLRQALRINPDYVRARDALAQLQARQ